MKTNIYSLLAFAGIALAMGSCSDNPDYPLDKNGQTGSVNLSELGVEVDDQEQLLSRADIDTSAFLVKIVDADGNAAYEATMSTCKEIVTLPVADGYTVQIHSHEVENAGWSAPYYYGQTTFDVKANDIAEIGTINCKFANIRVSVRYSDELLAIMGDDVTVTVKCSENGSALDFAKGEQRSGYFKALEGSTTLAAEFNGTVQGNAATLVKALNDVKAGQHRVITFGVKTGNNDVPDEFGGVSIEGDGNGVQLADGLYLTAVVTDETVNGNVNAEENGDSSAQRPGKEEDQEKPGPGPDEPVTPEYVDITSELDLDKEHPATGSSYLVNIDAQKGIAHLLVTIESDNENFIKSAGPMLLPDTFDEDKDTQIVFDLADTPDDDPLAELLPAGSKVKNQTHVPFDVTGLVPLLTKFPGHHAFKITVTDNEGNTLTKTLRIKA